MKRISMFFLWAVMAALCLSSCSDSNDGDGDPFKWKGLTESKTNTVSVPAVGGTVTLECKNYSGFWVVGVNETTLGNTVHYVTQPEESASGRQAGKWGTVTWQGKLLTVDVPRNDTGGLRTLEVMVQCGDVFSVVRFVQKDMRHLIRTNPLA